MSTPQLDELFPETEQVTTFMGYLTPQRVKGDEIVIAAGTKSNAIYIVEHGQVTIYTQLHENQLRRVATLGSGAILGHWSIPANGFVMADKQSRLYILTQEAHHRMEQADPRLAAVFFRFIAQVTGEHLLLANNTIDRLFS